MMKERGLITSPGAGGFLCPPTHPEHTQHVQTDLRRRPWNRGSLSLSSAVECDWLDDATRANAKRILDTWQENKPALDSTEIIEWKRQVLGYFAGCYKGDGENPWNCSALRITKDADPMLNFDLHAGVRMIRQYYPGFVPTRDDFNSAYWGTKTSKAGA